MVFVRYIGGLVASMRIRLSHLWKMVEHNGQSHYQHPHSSNHHTKENPFDTPPNVGLSLTLLGCSCVGRRYVGERAARCLQIRSILFRLNAVSIFFVR